MQNVTVEGSVTGGSYVGGVVGRNSGTVSGCASTVTVSGKQYVGGAVGYSSGVIKDTAVNATVTGSSSNVGGVVGIISGTNVIGGTSTGSSVEGCSFSGSVTGGTSYTGGIVGQSGSNCSVMTSYNVGSVTGGTTTGTGGIAGMTSGTINNCYNSGSVTSGGGDRVGGICGTASAAIVTACYNSGLVTNSGSYSGGVCGYVQAGLFGGTYSAFTNCYYDSDVNDSLETVGYYTSSSATLTDVEAKTTAQFNSGEVTWLLQNGQEDTTVQVWGQALTGDAEAYPVLTNEAAKLVVKLDFYLVEDGEVSGTAFDTRYTNSRATLASYPSSDETTYTFYTAETCADEDEIDTAAYTYSEDCKVYVASRAETFTVWYGETEITLDADETYDLTQACNDELGYGVPEGYLYGGTFTDEDFAEVIDPDTCGSGAEFTPVAGETYYVKLVDDSYFMIKCLLAYQHYVPTNLWLVTNIDTAKGYQLYGFDITVDGDSYPLTTETAAGSLETSFDLDGKTCNGSVDISDFTGFSDSDIDEDEETNLVGCVELGDGEGGENVFADLLEADSFTAVPFFVTADGVKVTGVVERTVSLTASGATSVSEMFGVDDEAIDTTTAVYEGEVGGIKMIMSASLNVVSSMYITNITDEDAEEEEEPTTYTITKYDGDTVTTQEVEVGAADVTVEYAEKDSYLFAGWFTDEDYTTAADFSEITGDMTVYAKYVSADYLQVKASTVSSKGVLKSIRMISATDSKNYTEAGFVYTYSDTEGSATAKYAASISGKTAKTLYGGSVVTGSKLIYADLSVSGMEENTAVTITPYWVTLDGTTVYGTERTITYTGSDIE